MTTWIMTLCLRACGSPSSLDFMHRLFKNSRIGASLPQRCARGADVRPVCSHFCGAGKGWAGRRQGQNLKVMTLQRREASGRRNGARNDFLASFVSYQFEVEEGYEIRRGAGTVGLTDWPTKMSGSLSMCLSED